MPSSVNLGDHLETFITEAVRNGRYGSRSEVLREGVRLVQEREKRLEQLDRMLAEGLDSLDRGDGIALEDAFEAVRAELRSQEVRRNRVA
ncbi:MAG TPA: type II toxin-antitoxin system ParD family antitoxin [Allosphingosinicella sp.]|jgi:antitoxin ParD1/3/4|nr:type II toxin-antitoxin system ParD family antitoxin [Allosphingosinicella sp.]